MFCILSRDLISRPADVEIAANAHGNWEQKPSREICTVSVRARARNAYRD
jgi:hypothetical protein